MTLVELLSSDPDLVSSSLRRSANLSLTSCLEAVLCGERLGLNGTSDMDDKVFNPSVEALTGK